MSASPPVAIAPRRISADLAPPAREATPRGDDAVAVLPPAGDPLTAMLNSGDPGSVIAALVMTSQKELRVAAKRERDLAYTAQAQAQNDELDAMRRSADTKLVTGLVGGGLQLGSAGCSMASAGTQFSASQPGADVAHLKLASDMWTGAGAGLTAYGTISNAVGGAMSESADRDAKRAGIRADNDKRTAEDADADFRDANKSIDKTIDFYQEYLKGAAASKAAAVHGA